MSDFHFLRPLILIGLPLFILLYIYIRKQLTQQNHAHAAIAPHLLQTLTPRQTMLDKLKPVDMVFAVCILLLIAAAGPSWQHQFGNDGKPPVVVVLKVSQSMLANDLAPNRLARAKQKIQDFLLYRTGAKTSLMVYAQTSHRVLPMTEDNEVFLPFIEALSPDVMPGGDSITADNLATALTLAQQELIRGNKIGGGAIVVIADDIRQDQIGRVNEVNMPFIWWQFATENGGVIVDENESILSDDNGQALAIKLNPDLANQLQQAKTQRVTLNQQDIVAIDQQISALNRNIQQQNAEGAYRDMTWYFVWPVVILVALWFRKGFTTVPSPKTLAPMRLAPKRPAQARAASTLLLVGILGCTGFNLGYSGHAQAEAADWFFTSDQQGVYFYHYKHYQRAAAKFADPMWRGTALYEAGKYTEAAQVFATVGTLDSLYNRANALFKSHSYPAAIKAYQQVLAQDPQYHTAQINLALAERALKILVEQSGNVDLEQSISLEVDDKTATQSQDGESRDYDVGEGLAADAKEQWMRSVDSDMSDFLSAKFANEANAQGAFQ